MPNRYLTLIFLLCASLPAQTVRLANHSAAPFAGWHRVTVDAAPPHAAGILVVAGAETRPDRTVRYVLGAPAGRDLWALDLQLEIGSGERMTIDLADAEPWEFRREPLPAEPLELFGGPVKVGGRAMQWVGLEADGAAWVAHLRRRVGRMHCVDLWARWYPGEAWAHGEALATCSNPSVPDLFVDSPRIDLEFGGALVDVYGRGIGEPLVRAGEPWADGQARGVPLTFVWPRRLRSPGQWASAGAGASLGVRGVGVARLLPDGNPTYPADFDPLRWARQQLPRAIAAIHTWAAPAVGIAPFSGQTGYQEGQQFVRGEALLEGGVGAELVAYLSGLQFANRPCHHLEADGSQIDVDGHPDLILWNARPHAVGADNLGKSGSIAQWDVPGGWYGPDRQHWMLGTLAGAHRQTGSRALQHLLEAQARLWLLGETVDSGSATDGPGSARSPGYAGMVAVYLWRELRDRDLAERVRLRWIERVERVYMPAWRDAPGGVWDVRQDARILQDLDPSYTHASMWWQQSWGAWGLWYGCHVLGPPEGTALAVRAAEAVVAHAWRRDEHDRWIFWDNVGYRDGSVLAADQYREGVGAHRTGWFDSTWAVPGLAVLLRDNPEHAMAREIWEQVVIPNSWVPPGTTVGR